LIIRLIIQTILLYPSGAVWTDGPSNVSRLDPSGAIQIDAEHPSRNRKVEVSVFRASDRALTLPGRWAQMILRIVGPVLFGLAVLSLRGRVRR
jgi:hypothetical protein